MTASTMAADAAGGRGPTAGSGLRCGPSGRNDGSLFAMPVSLAQADPTGFSSPLGQLVVLLALTSSLVVLLRWWWQQRKR